ncbi:hypothetical protein KC332_g1316 [Hortaea werneckii]|nr:hypothetical protein KC358_g661 [Hortaea werneckii]KAI6852654.1 hypothetical protein KC350_g697 [Hortaea werneckii]KAI6943794.1 hypothetical protein KC341_g1262 [Hortaea werneckii]KAI6950435.1 hypothetical protein KC348_g692 [Hortaea werneckii]KAI6982595.1 hypothetical protein KC321_g553 [Hortaea werneckii]
MQPDNTFDMYANQAPAGSAPQGPGQPQYATTISTPLPSDQDGTPALQSPDATLPTAAYDAYQYLPINSNQHLEASLHSVFSHTPQFAPQVIPLLHAQAGKFVYVSKWAYGLGPSPPQASPSAQQYCSPQPTTVHGMMEGSLQAHTASHLPLGVNQAYAQGLPGALTPSTQTHTPPTPILNPVIQKRLYGEVDGDMHFPSPYQNSCNAGQGGPKRQKVTHGQDLAADAGDGVQQRAERSAVGDLEFQTLAEAQQNQYSCVSVLLETAAKDKIENIHESSSKQRDWVKAIINSIGGVYQQSPGGEHDKFPRHVQEWQRFQSSNLAKVRKAMQEKGKRGIELAAWALLRAVLKGHSRGLRQTGTWTVDKRSTVTERLQKCVKAIQELPIVALDTLKGQGIHEFAANPESFAKRKIGNLWVNYYKKLVAKGTKIPQEERSSGLKPTGGIQQQTVAGAGGEHVDEGAAVEESGLAVEENVEEV